jgi:glutaredoxin
LLSRQGVAFVDRNVEEDDQASDELLALGFRSIPVTVIKGVPIRGYDEAAIIERLTSAGLRPPDR